MVHDELKLLSAFLTIAEERSFTKAARRLGVSPSALSHAMRALEEHIGVRLLARTTRHVAPTDAGHRLLEHLRPALADIRGTLEQLSGLRERPAGRVRLVVSRLAARMVLGPRLKEFTRRYPDVVLDVSTTNERRVDLVAHGFDAGIHLGESIQKDMVAVRVSPDQRPAIVGSPDYFAAHRKPKTPRDLPAHRCLNFRHGDDGLYRWELDKGKHSLEVSVDGPLIVDDAELLIRAAIDGLRLAYSLEESTCGQAHRLGGHHGGAIEIEWSREG